MGRRVEEQFNNLKKYALIFIILCGMVALDKLVLHTTFIAPVAVVGIFGVIAASVVAILRTKTDNEKDIGERVNDTKRWLGEFYPSLTAKYFTASDEEKEGNIFFTSHIVKGSMEIEGEVAGKAILFRERDVYDVQRKRSNDVYYYQRFYGTVLQWQEKGNGSCIITSPDFSKLSAYNFSKFCYDKLESGKEKPQIYIKHPVSDADKDRLTKVYNAALDLRLALEGLEIALWADNADYSLYICQLAPYRNNIPDAIPAVERFIKAIH